MAKRAVKREVTLDPSKLLGYRLLVGERKGREMKSAARIGNKIGVVKQDEVVIDGKAHPDRRS